MERDDEPVLLPALLACATAVGLQVVLPRLFSVLLWYHLGFLAVSLALLGFAVGGLWVARRGAVRPRLACGLAALSLPLAAAGAVRLAPDLLDPGVLVETLGGPARLLAVGALLALPFALLGLATCSALELRRARPAGVWAATFLGGAAGAALALAAMGRWGAPRALLALAAPPVLGALLPAAPVRLLAPVALMAAALCGAGLSDPDALLPLHSRKHYPRVDAGAVLDERWNTFSRVTFYENPAHHGLWGVPPGVPLPESIGVAIDAWAITSILRRAPGADADPVFAHYPPTLAYADAAPGFTALVIGAGGGIDVQAALAAGASRVTAVEINPLIVEAVRGRWRDWCGGLYDDPRVEVVVAEGRHFLATAGARRWDRIVLSGVDTFAATEAGAFALSENHLYTVEALRDLLDHLAPGGAVCFTRWWFEPPRQTLRLALTAAQVLRERGADPLRRLVIARTDLAGGVAGENSLLLLHADDPGPERLAALQRAAAARRCAPVFTPGAPSHPVFVQALAAADPAPFLAAYPFRVEPVTDDRPFFFEHNRLDALFRDPTDWIRYRLGGHELLAASLLVLLLLAAPLLLAARPPPGAAPFACLGAGYVLVEVALMQRLVLLLGHPVHAVAIVLVALLLWSGLGSWLAARVAPARLPLACLAAAALVASLGPAGSLAGLVGAPFAARAAAAVALVAPVGLCLGLPFPLAIRGVAGPHAAAAFLWNGVAAVLAGPVAALLSLEGGFGVTLLAGAACYLAAAMLFRGAGAAAGSGAAGAGARGAGA